MRMHCNWPTDYAIYHSSIGFTDNAASIHCLYFVSEHMALTLIRISGEYIKRDHLDEKPTNGI